MYKEWPNPFCFDESQKKTDSVRLYYYNLYFNSIPMEAFCSIGN